MKKSNKVSIIVPVYNAFSSIRKCIESIISQTYQHLEVILINDGSTDKSIDILREYEKKFNFIKVIDKKNEGVSISRNLGIEIATGKYIMFIDNDDFIDKDYVEKHVEVIIKENADVVISGYRRVKSDNKVLFQEKLKNTYWSRYIIMSPWAKIYRREFLIKYNIKFLDYSIGEDVYFNLSLFSKKPKILIMDYIGYNWFFNEKSVSNTSQRGLQKKTNILELLDNIVAKYDEIDDYLSYYLIRYYIWYLLFSGRSATSSDFIEEYYRIKNWYFNHHIYLKIMPWSYKLLGESLKNRIIVSLFILIEKLHLVKFFSKVYCKGKVT